MEGFYHESLILILYDLLPLFYGFLNEIMDHPCLDGGPESDRIRCTKFNEGCIKFYERCTKFCEGCTKRSKVSFKVGINPQSLPYEF